jgi:fructokinase
MKNLKVAGIGEILWDLLPEGKKLGGAPANFAYHAKVLGAESFAISSVGDDPLGKEIVDQLELNQLSTGYIEVSHLHPTGTVEVKLDDKGKPDFIIHKDVAWDYIFYSNNVAELAGSLDAICFGSLAQRSEGSRNSIRQMIDSTSKECLRIFDINMRQDYYNYDIVNESLKVANCFKLNEDEFPIVADMFSIVGNEEVILNEILSKFDLQIIALTKGGEGSILHTNSESSFLSSVEVEAIDTVGAGDAFTAAMGVGLLKNLPLKTIHEQATQLSAYVCTQNGAMPGLPEELVKDLAIGAR